MSDDVADRRQGAPARGHHATMLAWVLVAITIALVIVAVMLTPQELRWMRMHWAVFNWPMGQVERLGMATGLNVQHMLMFLWLSLLLRLTWRKASWWQLLLLLAGLAVGTELLQVLLPGRDPRVTDVRDDMLGAVLGWLLALPLGRIVQFVVLKCRVAEVSRHGNTSKPSDGENDDLG